MLTMLEACDEGGPLEAHWRGSGTSRLARFCSVFHFRPAFVADKIGDLASSFGVSVRVEDTDGQ